MTSSMLWRRLDLPGHDACNLAKRADGWSLDGTAVFRENDLPVQLVYHVTCDLAWRTRHGHVRGWLGLQPVAFNVARIKSGGWTLNGKSASGLEHCVDLDLGFTPATNLVQLRRLALAEGQAADVPVVWLDASTGTLERLDQTYQRRTETSYWYEAPRYQYADLLEVTPEGFIRRYPGLWESEF